MSSVNQCHAVQQDKFFFGVKEIGGGWFESWHGKVVDEAARVESWSLNVPTSLPKPNSDFDLTAFRFDDFSQAE